MFHLAYVFERFPTFTQTFCVREILELERIGVRLQEPVRSDALGAAGITSIRLLVPQHQLIT